MRFFKLLILLLATVGTVFALPMDGMEWFENRSAGSWPQVYEAGEKGWRPVEWPVRIAKTFSPAGKKTLILSAEFEWKETMSQGLLLMGDPSVQVYCNGRKIEPEHSADQEVIFALPLVKGRNILSIGLSKKTSLLLNPVELDYILPNARTQLEALARSVDHLAARYPAYPAARYRQKISQLAKGADSSGALQKVQALQFEALVKNNPEIDFDEILLRRTKNARLPANWQGNTGMRTTGYNNEIARLSLKDRSLNTVYRPQNGNPFVGDINLHFDAEKMLISSISEADGTWQVFELSSDGSDVRQVSPDIGKDVDNYNGTYLPNGDLIFCSTANMTGIPCIGGKGNVGTLYTAGLHGEDMRQLTFEQDADWYPWVMDDGKVMYLRWEYTDNSHYFTRILMTMNPDGSQQRSIYGSNSYWPSTLFYAKNIPGSNRQFAAIVSGHHGINREGELVLFDVGNGEQNTDGVVQRIPGYGKEVHGLIRDKYAVGTWPRFLHPYPLSDTYFLAAGRLAPGDRWGIYLLDRFDNIILLKDDPNFSLLEPVPLKPRPMPREIPSRLQPNAEDSVLYIQDIYEGPGLAGIPRGTVKELRLITYTYAYRNMGGHDALTIEGGWDAKRILGTVPVEEDGSVMVRVPHSTPISIQPLDADGAALQLMRSWLVAMPGESLSCIGCHESARMPPLQRTTLAMRAGPKSLTPWRGEKPHGFSYLREIQPILDRSCVGCHDGSVEGRPDFKTLEPIARGREFAASYHALHPYINRPGSESDFALLTPMDYHASTSELIQLLEKGHHGVELAPGDWQTLLTWIDLNVPYHPTWASLKGDAKVNPISERARELRKKYTGVDEDIDWMPPVTEGRPEFIQPGAQPQDAEPAVMAGLPFGAAAAKKMQGTENKHALVLAEGIHIHLRRIPNREGKAFWMAETEITNEQFRQFKADHDSRVIDQQWKDHIYAGYPADKPQQPVIRVSWEEAVAFCDWLSEKTGKKVSLPSEQQWEWACRAGSAESFFFGTESFGDYANLADVTIGELAVRGIDPQPVSANRRTPLNDFVPRDASVNDGQLIPNGVGLYKPNAWGLYDMHGNVAEWTSSSYDETRKAVRGGSWRDRPERATASFRFGYAPYQKVYNVGFRIIMEEE
jgi:hypothetical protein